MRESVSAAYIKSLCQGLRQAEKGTLSPLECLSFANTIQADLPTCAIIPIFIFLNSHPGSAFGRPVVMAGLRPAMTTGGLDD